MLLALHLMNHFFTFMNKAMKILSRLISLRGLKEQDLPAELVSQLLMSTMNQGIELHVYHCRVKTSTLQYLNTLSEV